MTVSLSLAGVVGLSGVGAVGDFLAAPAATTVLNQGFEEGVMPPSGWSVEVTNPAYTWQTVSQAPHSGSFAAQVDPDPSLLAPQNEWLLSPPLLVSEATLGFWSRSDPRWCRDVDDHCDLWVWLVVGEFGAGGEIFVGMADPDWIGAGVWSQSVFDLTPFLSGSNEPVRIGFNYLAWSERAGVAIDDVVVQAVSVEIFADGFESGDTSAWSGEIP